MIIRKNQPPKKLVINGLKDVPKLPANFGEVTWEKLSLAVEAIHNSLPISDSKESLYNAVKDLCVHKLSKETYDKLYEQCKNYLSKQAKFILLKYEDDNETFLTSLNSIWNSHCTQIRMIRDIFLYLDRTFIFQQSNIKSIWDMGLNLFSTVTLEKKEVITKLIDGLINLIENDRNNQSINKSILQNLLRMIISLDIYSEYFESPFLENTKLFYDKEGIKQFESNTVPNYLKYIESKLQEENDRVRNYLENSTKLPLMNIVQTQLIRKHLTNILDNGFFTLMNENSKEDLKRLYNLIDLIQNLNDLQSIFNSYIKVILFFFF